MPEQLLCSSASNFSTSDTLVAPSASMKSALWPRAISMPALTAAPCTTQLIYQEGALSEGCAEAPRT